MNVFYRVIQGLCKLPLALLVTHMVAKFIFGLGIGILFCDYLDFDRQIVGWILLIASIIVATPSTLRVLGEASRS